MAASLAQIDEVRRLVDEPTEDTYNDDLIATFIERYPLFDELGQEPYKYVYAASDAPPTRENNPVWIPTYDLHSAAAAIWEEKASALAQDFDFSADGGDFTRSQAYQQMMAKARHHLSRRAATSRRILAMPVGTTPEVIGNLPEPLE